MAARMIGARDGQEGPMRVIRLHGHSGDVDSALTSFALWDLSRAVRADADLTAAFDKGEEGLLDRLRKEHPDFATRFDRFVHGFGYRGPSEWDIGVHTWETQPELPLSLIRRLPLLDHDAPPCPRSKERAADP